MPTNHMDECTASHQKIVTSILIPDTNKPAERYNDAIELLISDHKELKLLFENYQRWVAKAPDNMELTALARKICTLLAIHNQIEEEIFYPAFRQGSDRYEPTEEALVEHAVVNYLIEQIMACNRQESLSNAKVKVLGEFLDRQILYDAKINVLGEYVSQHLQKEENEIFPKANKKLDLESLGRAMAARKTVLLIEAEVEETSRSNQQSLFEAI